jgi:hypothetical protein
MKIHNTTTTNMTNTVTQDSPRRLISPKPETRLSEVDGQELTEYLDQYELELDFNLEEATNDISTTTTTTTSTAGSTTSSMLSTPFGCFSTEELSKIKSLTEFMESLPEPPQKATEIVAEALQSMPMEKREQVVRDLYGVEDTIPNDPGTQHCLNHNHPVTIPTIKDANLLDSKLQEMEDHLQLLKATHRWNIKLAALEMAEAQNLPFTQDQKFRLKFLRCDRLDPIKAAGRFIRYFDWKFQLFSMEKLTKDIAFDDLTKEDQAMLKKGYIQRLPIRDRAGRAILVHVYNGQTYDSPESMVRFCWH